MDLNKIDAIIFDFGGVLINIDYHNTVDAFRSLGIPNFDKKFAQAQQTEIFDLYETGQITSESFLQGLQEFLPAIVDQQKLVDAWNAMILDVPNEVPSFLKNLKEAGKKLFLLSNTNEIHINYALKKWKSTTELEMDQLLNHIYLSHEIELRKPDLAIFEYVLSDQGLQPDRTLFIDDSIQHIESAKSMGIKTHHLTKQSDLYEIFS